MGSDRRIFDLSVIYTTFSYQDTLWMLDELVDIKNEVQSIIYSLKESGPNLAEAAYELFLLEEELIIINKNIITLKDALLCHETMLFDKFNLCGDIVLTSLN